MIKALQAYFRKPTTLIGIATAMMFQIIFSVIWMTGYDQVTDNTSRLSIAVVNEDQAIGKQAAAGLSSLPFDVNGDLSSEEAMNRLEKRDVHMVVHIPADFTEKLMTDGQSARLEFTINESNPALIKSIMQGVAANIGGTVNKEAAQAFAASALAGSGPTAAGGGASAAPAQEKVTSSISYIHPVQGMNNQMLPMMLVLASFVGAMIMAMNMHQSTAAIGSSLSRYSKFAARAAINAGSSFIIALIGVALVASLGGKLAGGFAAMWLFQSLFLMTFMFFSQMFLALFGQAGMLFNIMMLSIQLVSSGALVPRELLGSFYFSLSKLLPATYAVEGSMNLLFGGPGAGHAAAALAWIMTVCAGITLAFVAIRREKHGAALPG